MAQGWRYMSELEPSAWYVLEPSKFQIGQSSALFVGALAMMEVQLSRLHRGNDEKLDLAGLLSQDCCHNVHWSETGLQMYTSERRSVDQLTQIYHGQHGRG